MRSVEFIGTACLVTIYGRKYDVIFKRVENKFITEFKFQNEVMEKEDKNSDV